MKGDEKSNLNHYSLGSRLGLWSNSTVVHSKHITGFQCTTYTGLATFSLQRVKSKTNIRSPNTEALLHVPTSHSLRALNKPSAQGFTLLSIFILAREAVR